MTVNCHFILRQFHYFCWEIPWKIALLSTGDMVHTTWLLWRNAFSWYTVSNLYHCIFISQNLLSLKKWKPNPRSLRKRGFIDSANFQNWSPGFNFFVGSEFQGVGLSHLCFLCDSFILSAQKGLHLVVSHCWEHLSSSSCLCETPMMD